MSILNHFKSNHQSIAKILQYFIKMSPHYIVPIIEHIPLINQL
jgi:hypothetical protein